MKQRLFVGTYTHGEPKAGIVLLDFDSATGKLDLWKSVDGANDPSFLALAPDRRCLLATNEVDAYDGEQGGGIQSYRVDGTTGDLTLLNGAPTHGEHPAHVSFDATGRWAFAANYSGGSLVMIPVLADGRLGDPTQFIQHSGSSVNTERQDAPHVHSVTVGPGNRVIYVADLGIDQVVGYRLEGDRGSLDTDAPIVTRAERGAGPRHMTFDPSGRYAYVANELNNSVVVYEVVAATGALNALQSLSTLPDDFSGENTVAEIRFDAAGRYLFVSNRGHDSLAGFAVNPDSGLLTPNGWTQEGIRWPRHFSFDASGDYVLTANQKGHNVVVFRYDVSTGTLTPTGESVEVSEPVCIVVMPL